MAGNRARGSGYGSVGGAPGEEYRAEGDIPSSSGPSSRRQQWPWVRLGIVSIAVAASVGLLSASRLSSYTAPIAGDHLIDPASGGGSQNLAQNTVATAATSDEDEPHVSGSTTAAAGGDSGEDKLSFIASNEYTRRGDIIGLGYPWLQVSFRRWVSTRMRRSSFSRNSG